MTPSLPAFFNHCLQGITHKAAREDAKQVDARSPLLDTILQAFAYLIPNHPSACRPFVGQIKTLLAPLLAPTPSSHQKKGSSFVKQPFVSRSSSLLAQKLFALLPTCAPKNTASDEYSRSVKALVTHIHRTADHVFRAVVEEPRPPTSTVDPGAFEEIVSDKCEDEFGLSRWRGIYAGAERLDGLMHFLQAYISTVSAMPYNLPVGSIWHCVERLLGVVGPVSPIYKDQIGQLAQNLEIDRDEREGLWAMLPLIHIGAIETTSVLLSRINLTAGSICSVAINQLTWSFKACGGEVNVRKSIYAIFAQLLSLYGPSTSHAAVKLMAPLIRTCCEDVLPTMPAQSSSNAPVSAGPNKQSNNPSVDNPDSYLKPSTAKALVQSDSSELRTAALELLPLFLSKLPAQHLSSSIRTQIDRTAILVNDKEAMLASVLSPPQKRSKGKGVNSIMPFVARAHPDAVEIETLIRPRMPVIPNRKLDDGNLDSDGEGSRNGNHHAMAIDQDYQSKPSNGTFNATPFDFSHVQGTPSTHPLPTDEEPPINRNTELDDQPTSMQNQESPSLPSLSKRPRSSSPSPDDHHPSAEPPSKRINLDPLAPHVSSLPPVIVTEDKVFLDPDPNPIPTTEHGGAQGPRSVDAEPEYGQRPTADYVRENIKESTYPSALNKGKGRAVESDGGKDEGDVEGGEGERGEGEGSSVRSETPEINWELNPALFESSEEEE